MATGEFDYGDVFEDGEVYLYIFFINLNKAWPVGFLKMQLKFKLTSDKKFWC